MAFQINKEDKTLKLLKDCTTCKLIKVCKFHAKMRDLCTSSEFYEMSKYLEWNNSLAAFQIHASCQFYVYAYNNDELGLDSDPDVIDSILRNTTKPDNVNSWIKSIKDNTVSYNLGNKETLVVKLTDILAEWTIIK